MPKSGKIDLQRREEELSTDEDRLKGITGRRLKILNISES
jgi:hypothetical protein